MSRDAICNLQGATRVSGRQGLSDIDSSASALECVDSVVSKVKGIIGKHGAGCGRHRQRTSYNGEHRQYPMHALTTLC